MKTAKFIFRFCFNFVLLSENNESRMKRLYFPIVLSGLVTFYLCSCCPCEYSSGGSPEKKKTNTGSAALAPCIIYKTRADYSKNVPVTLSGDKSKIVSYPDRKDVYFQDQLAYPTELEKGFLLDNRGIGPDVAFLDFTYEEYSSLEQTPSAGELMNHILDSDPLLQMYQCGNRSDFSDIVKELNARIRDGKLDDYKKLR